MISSLVFLGCTGESTSPQTHIVGFAALQEARQDGTCEPTVDDDKTTVGDIYKDDDDNCHIKCTYEGSMTLTCPTGTSPASGESCPETFEVTHDSIFGSIKSHGDDCLGKDDDDKGAEPKDMYGMLGDKETGLDKDELCGDFATDVSEGDIEYDDPECVADDDDIGSEDDILSGIPKTNPTPRDRSPQPALTVDANPI